jgi:hypothetical protein
MGIGVGGRGKGDAHYDEGDGRINDLILGVSGVAQGRAESKLEKLSVKGAGTGVDQRETDSGQPTQPCRRRLRLDEQDGTLAFGMIRRKCGGRACPRVPGAAKRALATAKSKAGSSPTGRAHPSPGLVEPSAVGM